MTTLKITDVVDSRNLVRGDAHLDGNKLVWIRSNTVEAIAQKLRARFEFFRGSWFLDRRRGTPYLEVIFRKGTSDRVKTAIVRNVIETTPGIVRLDALTLTTNIDRSLEIVFEAKTSTTILRSTDFEPFLIKVPDAFDNA